MAVWSVPKLGAELLEKFGTRFGQSTDCLGGLCDNLCNKLCFWVLLGWKWPWILVPQSGTDAW